MIRVGLLLLGAAIAGEALTGMLPALERTNATWIYELEVALEEGAELAGWILVASGLTAADLLARRAGSEYAAVPEPPPASPAF